LSEDASLSLSTSISATSASEYTRAHTSPTPTSQISLISSTQDTSHSTLTSKDTLQIKKPRRVRMPSPENLPSDFRKVALRPSKIMHHTYKKPEIEHVDLKPTPARVVEPEPEVKEKVVLKHPPPPPPEPVPGKSPTRELALMFDRIVEPEKPIKSPRRSRTPSRFDDYFFPKEPSPIISRCSSPVHFIEGETFSHIKLSAFAHTQLSAGGSFNAAFLVRSMAPITLTRHPLFRQLLVFMLSVIII